MSLFRRSSTATPPTPVMDENKHAFFARKQNTSASVSTDHLGGKLSRKSLDDGHSGSTGSGGGFSHLFSRQETLTQAHKKLTAAVAAEKAADEALVKSRAAVKEARSEIAKLELEAKAEAKAAKAKLATASKFRKEGDKLGKH